MRIFFQNKNHEFPLFVSYNAVSYVCIFWGKLLENICGYYTWVSLISVLVLEKKVGNSNTIFWKVQISGIKGDDTECYWCIYFICEFSTRLELYNAMVTFKIRCSQHVGTVACLLSRTNYSSHICFWDHTAVAEAVVDKDIATLMNLKLVLHSHNVFLFHIKSKVFSSCIPQKLFLGQLFKQLICNSL